MPKRSARSYLDRPDQGIEEVAGELFKRNEAFVNRHPELKRKLREAGTSLWCDFQYPGYADDARQLVAEYRKFGCLPSCGDIPNRDTAGPGSVYEVQGNALRLLAAMEGYRQRIDALAQDFAKLTHDHPSLHRDFNAFKAAGGQTAAEFANFLDGRFRRHSVAPKQHLRLAGHD